MIRVLIIFFVLLQFGNTGIQSTGTDHRGVYTLQAWLPPAPGQPWMPQVCLLQGMCQSWSVLLGRPEWCPAHQPEWLTPSVWEWLRPHERLWGSRNGCPCGRPCLQLHVWIYMYPSVQPKLQRRGTACIRFCVPPCRPSLMQLHLQPRLQSKHQSWFWDGRRSWLPRHMRDCTSCYVCSNGSIHVQLHASPSI